MTIKNVNTPSFRQNMCVCVWGGGGGGGKIVVRPPLNENLV